MPAEKVECNRWSDTDLDEECQHKFKEGHFLPASSPQALVQINEL